MRAKKLYKKKKKRLGRGPGSGHGKTSTRGHKGQLARSGQGKGWFPGFEGGQLPLIRRVPKRGFNNSFKKNFSIVNLSTLVSSGVSQVNPQTLLELGIIKKIEDGVKILGDGEVKSPLTVEAHAFSASAKEKIEKAGGKAILIEKKK